MWCGHNLSNDGFEIRVEAIAEAVKVLSTAGVPARAKKYVKLEADLERGFRAVGADAALPYPTDGIIITAPKAPYSKTQNYKWKPYDMNTIDFLAVKCPKTLLGTQPYMSRRAEGLELYLLFVGIDHQMREKLGLGLVAGYRGMFPGALGQYYPVQFSPSTNPIAYLYYHKATENIDRAIVELSRNPENTEWVFHQTRTDRTLERNYFGNNYRVAELTYSNFVDKFEFENLWSAPTNYFIKTASDRYTAANKFKRFVISILLKQNLSAARWVIDAAAGRGADLHRYHEIGVENALFIDRDKTAITELINRKFTFFSAKKRHLRGWLGSNDANMEVVTKTSHADIEYDKLLHKDTTNMTVHTMVADLQTAADVLIARTDIFGINPGQVNGVVCNFALHYLCETADMLQNFIQFVARLLAVDGVFIFTVMNGERVFNELKSLRMGQTWQVVEDGTIKYAVKKLYDGKGLAKTGQKIAVKLPFSDEMYEEPLCNIENVIAVAKRAGLEVEQNSSMIDHAERFKKADRALYDRLTQDDLHYVELHSYVTMRKVKVKSGGK
jgi:SAM-dependent methyltransferase